MVQNVAVLLGAVAVCLTAFVSADDTQTTGAPQPVDISQVVAMQIQQEEMVSRMYLDTMLTLQHSAYTGNAASQFAQLMQLEGKQKRSWGDATSFLERESHVLEEEDGLFVENNLLGEDTDSGINYEQARVSLLGAYNLLRANNIKLYQIMFSIAGLQQEFYMNRILQLTLQHAQLPPQLSQIVQLKQYITMLKTLKLSAALQTVNHFRTWLEDELDVNGAIVQKTDNHVLVAQEQEEALIKDKMFAFNAFYMYSALDFQIMYFQTYLDQAFHALMQAPPAQPQPQPDQQQPDQQQQPPARGSAPTFLELESEAQPSQFFAGAMQANPMAMVGLYKMYQSMFRFFAAQSALTSVHAEQQALTKLSDATIGNDQEGIKLRKFAQSMFGQGFAQYLHLSAQMEYFVGVMQLSAFYGPMMGAPQHASN